MSRKTTNKKYEIEVEFAFLPFPNEQARQEAYYTHARLFLRAKERMLKEKDLPKT